MVDAPSVALVACRYWEAVESGGIRQPGLFSLVLRWHRPNDRHFDLNLSRWFTRFSILSSFLV
jgi:hypothetical protein